MQQCHGNYRAHGSVKPSSKYAGHHSETAEQLTKWCKTVVKNRRKDGKVAGFRDLTEFVEYAAKSANDPIYSKEALNSAKIKASPPSNFTEKI